MKKSFILYKKIDITAPDASNEPVSSSIQDSNGTNSASPQNMQSFCYTLVPIYMGDMLFIPKPEKKTKMGGLDAKRVQ